jgi:hypothetical protein
MELFKASNQWQNRPDDERFASLEDLHAAVSSYRKDARTASVPFNTLRTEAREGEVVLVGKTNQPARLTNWAFGQVATSVGAPGAYLRTLPATLAAQNLNHGLAKTDDRSDRQLLLHTNGSLLARALTSDKYTRIWNSDISWRLLQLPEQGWQVPPARPARSDQKGTRPATAADVLRGAGFGLSIQIGDLIAPAGLYASDHDMFAFLVNNDKRISEPGNPDGLARGFFVENSEVGNGKAFKITRFMYRHVCGNHIVWGAQQVSELRIKHIGDADDRAFQQIQVELTKYANDSASDDEARIRTAANFILGATKDEVLDRLFNVKALGLSRVKLEAAYDLTVECEPAAVNPNSAWGVAQGITRLSQQSAYADERTGLDKAAGRVLAMAF